MQLAAGERLLGTEGGDVGAHEAGRHDRRDLRCRPARRGGLRERTRARRLDRRSRGRKNERGDAGDHEPGKPRPHHVSYRTSNGGS